MACGPVQCDEVVQGLLAGSALTSDAEVLYQYMARLKPNTRYWVLVHDPSTMHKAAKWAER